MRVFYNTRQTVRSIIQVNTRFIALEKVFSYFENTIISALLTWQTMIFISKEFLKQNST